MATPQAVTAVIRAARPDFKSSADRVVFAVHAIVSVNGFTLRQVGRGVDDAVAQGPSSLPAEESDIAGWNQHPETDGGMYSFLYLPEAGTHQHQTDTQAQQARAAPLLLLKCLCLDGGTLLVSLADTASGRPPATLELQLDRYAAAGGGYEQLPELISRVQEALMEALEGTQAASGSKAKVPTVTSSDAVTSTASGRDGGNRAPTQRQEPAPPGREAERPDPLRDDRFAGPRRPPGWPPGGVGDDDLMPGGLMPPPGLGGVLPLGPRGMGGGMHVGPENPIFADRLRHPRHGGPGGGPFPGPGGAVPGMRWDPINPEGLQGWSPEDFARGGSTARDDALNDIGRPPPGRGPDWDHMFG